MRVIRFANKRDAESTCWSLSIGKKRFLTGPKIPTLHNTPKRLELRTFSAVTNIPDLRLSARCVSVHGLYLVMTSSQTESRSFFDNGGLWGKCLLAAILQEATGNNWKQGWAVSSYVVLMIHSLYNFPKIIFCKNFQVTVKVLCGKVIIFECCIKNTGSFHCVVVNSPWSHLMA